MRTIGIFSRASGIAFNQSAFVSRRYCMQTANDASKTLNTNNLRRMVGPDKHRPGPARYRLLEEQIPVWAIIGHLKAIAEATDQPYFTEEVISQATAEYDVRREAVIAALLYYEEHRGAIDALLEANAAALA
jgi:hypothetical protein